MPRNKIFGADGHEIKLNFELHPGDVLNDELHARKITKTAFAAQIGIYASHLSEILKGKRNVTANIALRLEKALGISAESWLGLQMDYDLYQERHKQQKAA